MAVRVRRQRNDVEKLQKKLIRLEVERAEFDLWQRQRRQITNDTILDRDIGGYIV